MHEVIDFFRQYGVDPNTTFTIIITLSIFITGFVFTWLGYEAKLYKERKSYRKSHLLILADFEKSCRKQSKVIRESLFNSGFTAGKDFHISHVVIATLSLLEKVDFNSFLQNFQPWFFNKGYNKSVSKLFELFALIKSVNTSIFQEQKELYVEFKKHEKVYYENLSTIRKMFDELHLRMENKDMDD